MAEMIDKFKEANTYLRYKDRRYTYTSHEDGSLLDLGYCDKGEGDFR